MLVLVLVLACVCVCEVLDMFHHLALGPSDVNHIQ